MNEEEIMNLSLDELDKAVAIYKTLFIPGGMIKKEI
jgi:hypothetical protein